VNESPRGDEAVTRRTRDSKAVLPRKKRHRRAATARSRESRFSPGVTRRTQCHRNGAFKMRTTHGRRRHRSGTEPDEVFTPATTLRLRPVHDPARERLAYHHRRTSRTSHHVSHVAMAASSSAPERLACWKYALEAIINGYYYISVFMIIVFYSCYNCIVRKS